MRNLFSWLFGRKPAPAAAPVVLPTMKDSVDWRRMVAQLGAPEDDKGFNPLNGKRVDYKLPDVLPGVRPSKMPAEGDGHNGTVTLALDSGYKEMLANDAADPAAWGFSQGGSIGPGLAFLGFPFLAELTQITEYRTPAESLSTEMVRQWLKLKNKGKNDLEQKLKELTEDFERFKIRDLFREAALKCEEFGRAHIYISIKEQDGDRERQLPLVKIEKDSIVGFSTIEPYWLTPYSWNATHPERPDFYKPQSWFVLGRKTHTTRLMTFIFREVPDLLKPAYDFSGISITQLMMPYVNRWLRTAKNVNDLINIFSIVTLATDLQSMLQQPNDSPKGLLARVKAFVQSRDNRGMMMVNKDTEELSMNNVPLSSLDKLQAQAQEHMATPGRMPLIKFFGITPTGLSATSDGEFQSWYDYVHALQELGMSPHAKRTLELLQMNRYGMVDPDIDIEWLDLYEPTGKEKAELRKADADRDAVYVEKNVIAPDEVRNRLRKDPESGYDSLEGDAPEPQAWNGGPPEVEVDADEDGPPAKKD